MPFPVYEHRVEELYKQYRRNPQMFTPSQIDELEQLAGEAGIPFSRKQEEFNLIDNAKAAVNGFVAGMTTLPVGQEPVTTYEKISHSLGHLAGFAPSILAAPVGMVSRALAKVGTKSAIKAAGKVANLNQTAIPVLDKLSVPMIGSRYSKKLIDRALEKSGLDAYDFLKKGAKSRDILNHAVGLGTASTVSGIWAGPDEYLNTFVGGALAGGAFGGIGNWVSIGNRLKFAKTDAQRKAAEGVIKAGLGATVTGFHPIIHDAPTEEIIYQILLGGFFGYKSRPAAEVEGSKFFHDLAYGAQREMQWNAEAHPNWNKFSKGAQDYINARGTDSAKNYLERPEILGKERATAVVEERAFLNSNMPMDQLKDAFGGFNPKGQALIDKAYREYAYRTFKTFNQASPTNIKAYPSAVDDRDLMLDKEDITNSAIVTPRIIDLYKKMIRAMNVDTNLKMPVKSMDLASIIQTSFAETKGKLPSEFIQSLERSDIGKDVVGKFKKELTQWFHQTNQELKPAMVAEIDSKGGVITYPLMGDFNGKNVGIKGGNFPINENESGPHMLLTHIKIRDNKGNVKVVQPFDQIKRKNAEGEWNFENVLTPDMLYKLQADLYNKDVRLMIDSGVKDKTSVHISDYHVDTYDGNNLRYTPRQMNGLLDKPVEIIDGVKYDFDKVYNYSLDLMYNLHGVSKPKHGQNITMAQENIKRWHDGQWVSNILKMAEKSGLHKPGSDATMEKLYELKSKDYYKNVVDFNKRRQGDFDRSIPMNPRAFRKSIPKLPDGTDGKFKFAFFEDLDPSILNTNLKSATDGTMILRSDVFKDAAGYMGSEANIGFHKPVIKSRLEGQLNHTYIKSAAQKASPAWDRFMEENALNAVIFNSANKHKGNSKSNSVIYRDGEYIITEPIATEDYSRLYTVPVDKLRISLTTAETPDKSIGFQYAPIQLSEVLNYRQTTWMGKDGKSINAAKLFAEEIIDPSINGKTEVNNLFTPENIKNETEILKKLRADKHFVDNMDVKLIHKMLVDHPNSKVTESILKQVIKLERESLVDDVFVEQDLQDITYRNTTILREGDLKFPVRSFNKFSVKQFERAYDKYIMKRLRNPKIRESAKVILKGVQQDAFDSPNIIDKGRAVAPGEIILDSSLRKMLVKDPKYKNLGDMFDKGAPIELVVIRVPADSVSGVRILKLRGFTKEKGTGATTHPEDDLYMGGADKDIDSAFIFEGFSGKLKEAYRRNANEWKDNMESKPIRDDDLFAVGRKLSDKDFKTLKERENNYKTTLSKFSPSMRINVARNSRAGNQAIGFSVVAKKKLYDIWNYELERKNTGTISKRISPEEVLEFEVTEQSGNRLRDLGRQSLNRAADAADYPMFIPMDKIPDMMVREALKGRVKNNKTGEVREAKASDLYKAYRSNIDSIDSINPHKRNYDKDERKLFYWERQVLMNNIDPRFESSSIWGEINKRVQDKGLSRDYRHERLNDLADRVVEGRLEDIAKKDTANKAIEKKISELFNIEIKINDTMLNRLNKNVTEGEKLYEMLYNDLDQVAGKNSIVKAYEKILSQLRNPEISGEYTNVEKVAMKVLTDISRNAVKDKQTILNLVESDVPKEASKLSSEAIDNIISNRKSDITRAILHQRTAKHLNPNDFVRLYETILLSPFKQRGSKLKGNKYKPSQSVIPWNTRFISDTAKRNYLKEFNNVVELIEGPSKISREAMSKVIYKPVEEYADMSPVKRTTSQVNEFIKKLNYKAITPEQVEEVRLLKDTLKKYPDESYNIQDIFESWQGATRGVVKDISLANEHDLRAFNKFLKGENPKELDRWIYYKHPRQVSSEQMKHDMLIFNSYQQPVKTSDGMVKRSVKRMTSTMGAMKDWFLKADNEKQFHIDAAIKDNIENIKLRKLIRSRKDRDDINTLIIYKRELKRGSRFEDTLKPEIDKLEKSLSKKYKNLDTLVEQGDKAYTRMIKEFGDKWIYSKDVKGIPKKYPFVKRDKNGIINVDHFIKYVENAYTGKEFPIIPLEIQFEVHYEMTLNKLASRSKRGVDAYKEWYRKKYPPTNWMIGRRDADKYWHKRYGTNKSSEKIIARFIEKEMQKSYDEIIAGGGTKNEANIVARITKEGYEAHFEKTRSDTGGVEYNTIESIISGFDYHTLSPRHIASRLENIGFFSRTNSVLERTLDLPVGYETTPEAFDMYKTQLINSNYKNLAAIIGDHRISDFMKRKPMDKDMQNNPIKLTAKRRKELDDASTKDFRYRNNTDVYADYLRLYLRDYLGHQSTFPERMVHAMSTSDPLRLTKNLYYGLSDQVAIKYLDKLNKRWKKKFNKDLPFLKDLPEGTDEATMKKRAKIYSNLLKNMSRQEARYQLLTLLANTGTMTANFFGGSSNIIGSAGLKNFTRANNTRWLKKNLLVDKDGNYNIFLKNGKPVTDKATLREWIAEKGVLDTLVRDEFEFNPELKSIKDKIGLTNYTEFMKQFSAILRNPKATDMSIRELFNKYGVGNAITKKGAWFMNKSERYLRATAFLSHAIRARNRFGKDAVDLPLDDPYIIQAGLDGIEVTQFLYNSQSRPAFMRSSLGRMMSRFKLFAFNSVRLRKEFYKAARDAGFKEGTEEFNKMKDLTMIDLFTAALGSMFAYSLFDTSLPPPWDWLQESSEWLFGNKRERERAFFGTYPGPFAPLQIVTPPVARIPTSILSSFVNDDWERFMDYHIYNMIPFGRIVRQVDKTIDEPYGTTFGRGMQQFFRLPTDKLVSKIDRAKRREEREEEIRKVLGD